MSPSRFCERVIALFGRFESEGAMRATLRNLPKAGVVSVAAYAARTIDHFSRACANFAIENNQSLEIDHFTSNIANCSS